MYAHFQSITFFDSCGSSTIPGVLLSFAPGEPTTIVAPWYSAAASVILGKMVTRAFNPAGLPCPPQHIIEEEWYSPEPRVPYRPIFALPEKLRSARGFPQPVGFFFGALDPPYALTAQNAIAPPHRDHEHPAPPEKPAAGDLLTLTSEHFVHLPTAAPAPVHNGVKTTTALKQVPSHSNNDHPAPPNHIQTNSNDPDQIGQNANVGPSAPVYHSPPLDVQKNGDVRQGFDGVSPKAPNQGAPQIENQAPGKSFATRPTNVQISPSSIKINEKFVSPESLPVSFKDGSYAIVDKAGQNIAVSDKIYQSLPKSPTTTAGGSSTLMRIALLNEPDPVSLPPVDGSGKPANLDANRDDQGRNHIDEGDSRAPSSLLSIYDTTLTPGGLPVTLADSAAAEGHRAPPLTLFLDPNKNIIYNPTIHGFPTSWSQHQHGDQGNDPLAGPVTGILNHQPLVILPDGQGVSIAGTTLYPSDVLASLTINDGKAEMLLSGTRISLLGTSALVVGSSTIALPMFMPLASTGTVMAGAGNYMKPDGTRTSQEPETFTGGASSFFLISVYQMCYSGFLLVWLAIAFSSP